jgi:hypothetical protein
MLRHIRYGAIAWACCASSARAEGSSERAAGTASASSTRGSPEAGDSTSDVESARRYYIEGSRLVEAREWRRALAAYERAFALYPAASTLFNMAYCRSQLGNLVEAWLLTSKALAVSGTSGALGLSAQRRAVVEVERERLRSSVSSITFGGGAMIAVRVRGGIVVPTEFEAGAYRLEQQRGEAGDWAEVPRGSRLLLDPGRYVLSLRHGFRTEQRELELAPAEAASIDLVEMGDAAATGTVPTKVATGETRPMVSRDGERAATNAPHRAPPPLLAKTPRVRTSVAATPADPYKVAGMTTLALGGAGFVVAAVSAGVRADASTTLSRSCTPDGVCQAADRAVVQRYRTATSVTNVGLIVGTVASGLGVGLLWASAARARQALALQVSSTEVWLGVTF